MESVKNLKQTNILKYFLIILISSTLLAISAKLKIPFYPVPMTMQTFVVLLIGVCFGWKLGRNNYSFYLLEGISWITCIFWNSRKRIWNNLFCWTNNGILNRIYICCDAKWYF